jgi:hypothetical protein
MVDAGNKTTEIITAHNNTYPKGGVSCSKDSFVVGGSLVFQIKFCGKSPALRVAANRRMPFRFAELLAFVCCASLQSKSMASDALLYQIATASQAPLAPTASN